MEKQQKTNPKFPYCMEKVRWYLLFMFFKQIISEDELDELISRIPKGY